MEVCHQLQGLWVEGIAYCLVADGRLAGCAYVKLLVVLKKSGARMKGELEAWSLRTCFYPSRRNKAGVFNLSKVLTELLLNARFVCFRLQAAEPFAAGIDIILLKLKCVP